MITSNPITPSQPAEALYPPTKLELFPRLTRATYKEVFGVEPPAWDKTRRIKRWFDTSVLEDFRGDAANEVVVYDVFDATSATGTRRMTMTVAEASTPNLPGKMVYPKYVVAPTPAVIVTPVTGERSGVNPNTLCYYREAVALAAELGLGADAVSASVLDSMFVTEWNGEPRRPWVIQWRDSSLQASLMLKLKYVNGVGAPGHWDMSVSSPAWVAEYPDTGEQDARPEVPMPVRLLLPNERIHTGFAGLVMIQRTDLAKPTKDELLERIDARVAAIARAVGA